MTRCSPCAVCHPLRAKIERPMPPPPDDARFHLPIAELEHFEVRWVNALEAEGVIFVGQLLMLNLAELRSPGEGPAFRQAVLAAVRRLGFVSSRGRCDG